uniref:DNA polymerase II subunit 2 n=1 Tax=Propithecus coquereli TaxID=379532 RepID=A0A2K6GSJ1_PROCO
MAPERVRSRALSAFKLRVSSNMIERSVVEAAVQECSQSVDETMYVDKIYFFPHWRSHRHELFTPPVIGCHPDESRSKFQLKTIETLLGSTTKIGDVIILGMITQLKEGKFFLEDPTGTVQLDLSKFHSGLYTEACFVLAEGKSVYFFLSSLLAYYGNTNFFGGPSNTSVKISAKLKQLEEENKDAMFVFISDVWLDQVEVLEKLHTMFSGSAWCSHLSFQHFGRLSVTIIYFSINYVEFCCSSRFVFVPGPEDPGFGSILPRPPLAESIANEFRQRVPFSVFTTNPCRIQYCTQEIIVFREDLVNKMCRNCVRFPSSNLAIPNHFVKTILSQGHLTPLPLYVCPVYWAYDYALRVYPVPDLLVIADKYDPFTVTNTECLCINPGSFPRSGFSFKVFYPSNKTVEDSKLQGF